jgi:hypothetical protein
MKEAKREILAIVYSPRSADEILEELKPYVSFGDSLDDVEKRNGLQFVDHPSFRGPPFQITNCVCEDVGLWISVAGTYGVINIVRLRRVLNGVAYPESKLGEKPLPRYFPFESEEAMNEHLQMVEATRRKLGKAKAREEMPFFKRFWSVITDKD